MNSTSAMIARKVSSWTVRSRSAEFRARLQTWTILSHTPPKCGAPLDPLIGHGVGDFVLIPVFDCLPHLSFPTHKIGTIIAVYNCGRSPSGYKATKSHDERTCVHWMRNFDVDGLRDETCKDTTPSFDGASLHGNQIWVEEIRPYVCEWWVWHFQTRCRKIGHERYLEGCFIPDACRASMCHALDLPSRLQNPIMLTECSFNRAEEKFLVNLGNNKIS